MASMSRVAIIFAGHGVGAVEQEVGVMCVRNSGLLVLDWKVSNFDDGSEEAGSRSVVPGHNDCIDLAKLPGIADGVHVIGNVHAKWGQERFAKTPVVYKSGSSNRATFRCEGTSLWFGCKLDAPCLGGEATLQDRRHDLFQCDRECRWHFGFNNRSIVGERKAWSGVAHRSGSACCCYKGGSELNYGGLIERTSEKAFDVENTWSGTESIGFDSQWACVQVDGGAETMDKTRAKADGRHIIHCGKCAECSAMDSVAVLANTRKWITYVMTKTSTKFAAPWGHKNVSLLERDLFDLAIGFSAAEAEDDEKPSCMRCWSDNIMCDAAQCVSKCWTKFFDPTPTQACLECDERTCGPEFIKCAGANRRSTGIVSDIPRPAREQCVDGHYFGVPEAKLPTLAKPSDQEINKICNRNAHDAAEALV